MTVQSQFLNGTLRAKTVSVAMRSAAAYWPKHLPLGHVLGSHRHTYMCDDTETSGFYGYVQVRVKTQIAADGTVQTPLTVVQRMVMREMGPEHALRCAQAQKALGELAWRVREYLKAEGEVLA